MVLVWPPSSRSENLKATGRCLENRCDRTRTRHSAVVEMLQVIQVLLEAITTLADTTVQNLQSDSSELKNKGQEQFQKCNIETNRSMSYPTNPLPLKALLTAPFFEQLLE